MVESPLSFLDTDSGGGDGAAHTGPAGPHQWQRYVRRVTASASVAILVFAGILTGYILFLQRVGSEDSLLATIATFVVGLGIIPATGFAVFLVFRRVEPDLDSYMNSRFAFSFQNGSWPVLSMKVSRSAFPKARRQLMAVSLL